MRYTRTLVEIVYGYSRLDPESELYIDITMFLCIFNGNIRDPRRWVHHHTLGCPCGILSLSELRSLAALTYVKVVFRTKPPVPALSRWLRCLDTASWFLLLGLSIFLFCMICSSSSHASVSALRHEGRVLRCC